jgi:hypothetical protein
MIEQSDGDTWEEEVDYVSLVDWGVSDIVHRAIRYRIGRLYMHNV